MTKRETKAQRMARETAELEQAELAAPEPELALPEAAEPPVSDQELADEYEAEKVWTIAAMMRAANTGWGIDAGVETGVMEARALMAEARRQVRGNVPIDFVGPKE